MSTSQATCTMQAALQSALQKGYGLLRGMFLPSSMPMAWPASLSHLKWGNINVFIPHREIWAYLFPTPPSTQAWGSPVRYSYYDFRPAYHPVNPVEHPSPDTSPLRRGMTMKQEAGFMLPIPICSSTYLVLMLSCTFHAPLTVARAPDEATPVL